MKNIIRQLRYFVEGFAVALLFGFFRLLPFDIASAVAGKIGKSIGPFVKVHKVARYNLQKAFPEYDEEKINKILSGMWENLGRTIGEFPHMGAMDEAMCDRIVELHGFEHAKKAGTLDKPAFFVSGHFANWEILPKITGLKLAPLDLVYRPANNPLVNRLINYVRGHYQGENIPKGKGGAKKLLSLMRQNHNIGILVDQKMNDGIEVPFFGRNAMTAPALASLALKFDCPIVMGRVERVGNKARFRMTLYPPLLIKPSDDNSWDIYETMKQINAIFEDWIRERPEQWFWVHKRWPDSHV